MHRHDPLHELDVTHQPDVVVGEKLDRGGSANPARVEGRGVHVTTLHEAEHLTCVTAYLERLAIELPRERVERAHDVADGLVPVVACVRGLGTVCLFKHTGIGLGDHLLAEVHADEVLLEDVVVEHELGGLAQVDDLLAERRGAHSIGHVLRVAGARGMVIAADAADPAGDEMGVAGILALHEDAVAPEDRRGAVALSDFALAEVDLGVDPQAAHDAGDRVPGHFHQALGVLCRCLGCHCPTSQFPCSQSLVPCLAPATSARARGCAR